MAASWSSRLWVESTSNAAAAGSATVSLFAGGRSATAARGVGGSTAAGGETGAGTRPAMRRSSSTTRTNMPSVTVSSGETHTASPSARPARTMTSSLVERRISTSRNRSRLPLSTTNTWFRPRSAAHGRTTTSLMVRPEISASTNIPADSGGRKGSLPGAYGSFTSAITCTIRLTGSISPSVLTMRPCQT